MESSDHGQHLTVILIDDDENHLDLIQDSILDTAEERADQTQFEVVRYGSVIDALSNTAGGGPVVFVCDYQMPGGNGLDWLPHLIATRLGPVIILTSAGSESIATKAFEMGAARYLVKSEVIEHPSVIRQAIRDASRRFLLDEHSRGLLSQLRESNRDLTAKNERLRTLVDFACDRAERLSKELSDPLIALRTLTNETRNSPELERSIDEIRSINKTIASVTRIVSEFAEDARLGATTGCVDRRRHAVSTLLGPIMRSLAEVAASRNTSIETHIEAECKSVSTDARRLRRLLESMATLVMERSPESTSFELRVGTQDHGAVRFEIRPATSGTAAPDTAEFERVDLAAPGACSLDTAEANTLAPMVSVNLGRLFVAELANGSIASAVELPPAHRQSLIAWHAEFTRENALARRLVAIRVLPGELAFESEALLTFLSDTCYPHDLILEPSGQEILIVGACDDASGWLTRLGEAQQANSSAPAMRTSIIGEWDINHPLDGLLDAVGSEPALADQR